MSSGRRIRILLVDDEETVRRVMKALISGPGVEVATAPSGELALEELARSPADIVISDHLMGGMDGVELLREVRERWPDTRRVLLTGRPATDIAMNAVNQAEVHRFLVKGGDPEEIRDIVRELVGEVRSARTP